MSIKHFFILATLSGMVLGDLGCINLSDDVPDDKFGVCLEEDSVFQCCVDDYQYGGRHCVNRK